MGQGNRTYSRVPAELYVWVRSGGVWEQAVTGDISRSGLFIRTQVDLRVDQVIQLRIELPTGETLEPLARVTRLTGDQEDPALGPGLGVAFFAVSKQLQANWDSFLTHYRIRSPSAPNYAVDVESLLDSPLLEARESLRRARETGQFRVPGLGTRPAAPPENALAAWAARNETWTSQPAHREPASTLQSAPEPGPTEESGPTAELPPRRAVRPSQIVTVRPTSVNRLRDLARRCALGEQVFLRANPGRRVGDPLAVALVHPETQIEHTVLATVLEVVCDAGGSEVGVQAQFERLEAADAEALAGYVG